MRAEHELSLTGIKERGRKLDGCPVSMRFSGTSLRRSKRLGFG